MRSTPCDLVGKGTCDCASKIQATLFLKLRHFPLCGQTPSKCSYVIVRQPMAQTDSSLSHTNFGALLIQYVCIFGLFPVGISVLRSDQHIGWTTAETSQVRGRQESFDPAMFLLGFQKRDSETVNRRIAGAVENPPSTHSKPCLPSTGSSSHTATKTHFAPDEQQLWLCAVAMWERWKNIALV